MMEWMIAHNMGILLILTPMVIISWILVEITEKIKKIAKKYLTK